MRALVGRVLHGRQGLEVLEVEGLAIGLGLMHKHRSAPASEAAVKPRHTRKVRNPPMLDAVGLVEDQGRGIAEVARSLGVRRSQVER